MAKKSGFRANFTAADFRLELEKRWDKINKAIIIALQVLGEELVNYAVDSRGYTDQTGALTNSFGYVLVVHGKIYSHFFPGDGIGATTGRQLADELATRAYKGYALIVVAGMNYSAAVESMGYNVLAAAELKATSELPKVKAEMLRKIKNMR